MDTQHDRRTQPEQAESGSPAAPSPNKQPWQEPKLRFVEPTLTKQGTLEGHTH